MPVLALLAAFLTWAIAPNSGAAEANVSRVLLLFANDHRVPAAITISEGIRARLIERLGTVHFYSDFLDLTRFPSEADQERTARFLTEKYANVRMDAVIAIGPQALLFTAQHWIPGVPSNRILFSSVTERTAAEIGAKIAVAGTSSNFDYSKSLELARSLQPGSRSIVVVHGASSFDLYKEAEVRVQLAPVTAGLDVQYWAGPTLEVVVARAAQLPSDTIVLLSTFYGDASGKVFVPTEAIAQIVVAASAPVYSVYGGQLGRGLVGGYIGSFEDDGRTVADLAADAIEGKDLGPAPVRRPVPNAFRVDARQLDRWGFSRANLPPDTIVMFEKPSLWDEHRYLVLATLAVIAVQSALVIALLVQRRRMRRAEAEAALQRREVAHLMRVSVLGELSGAIAHEINQPLTAILSNAHAAIDMVPQDAPEFAELRETLQDIVQEDNRAGEVVNRLRRLLKKGASTIEAIDMNELVTATIGLLRSESIARGVMLKANLADNPPLASGDPIQVQQVLLNLIVNAMDAMASTPASQRIVTVSTATTPAGGVEVLVRDRGPGISSADQGRVFEPFYTTKDRGLGLGLTICSTIVQAHGGTLTLANNDNGGAMAVFSLPGRKDLAAAE